MATLQKEAERACLELRRRKSYGEDVDTTPEGFARAAAKVYESVLREVVDALDHEVGNRERNRDESRAVLLKAKAMLG
jgi:imidazolonepropionase-like amidohydrolase